MSLIGLWNRIALFLTTLALTIAGAAQTSGAPTNEPAVAPVQSTSAGTQASQSPSQPAPRQGDNQLPIANDQAGDQEGAFVFKKQVNEVVLHATVVDGRGALVMRLDRPAFTIFEDGIPQTITSFQRQDVPVAIGVVVDNSGSMRDRRAQVNQAVLNLIRSSNPQDEVFVVNFSSNPYLDQDFTADVNLLEQALHQVSMQGSTALYDAIVASETHLRNNPRLEKKVLLVITDGKDNMSRQTLQEAQRVLQREDAPTFYAIGLMNEQSQFPGREALQRLADATGGAAFFSGQFGASQRYYSRARP